MKIPIVIPPEDDELLYSWQLRLSKANGFDTLSHFAQYFIYPNYHNRKALSDRRVCVDGREEFMSFAEAVLTSPTPPAVACLYEQTTLFNVLAPYFTFLQQVNFTHTAFHTEKYSIRRLSAKRIFRTLHYCPICVLSEMSELGFYYAHRSHQVPGVSVCYKHRCTLVPEPFSSNPCTTENSENHSYALFVHDLLQHPHCITWSDMRHELLKSLGPFSCNTKEHIQAHPEMTFTAAAAATLRRADSYINLVDGINFSILHFGTIESLEAVFPPCADGEYLISLWNTPDTNHPTNHPLSKGTRNENYFRNEINALVGNEYQLVSFPSANDKRVSIKHIPCGQIAQYRIHDFLNGKRCRHCSKQKSIGYFKNFVHQQSCGRYRCDGREGNNLVKLTDTSNGQQLLFSYEFVLQELTRPTASPYLPCTHPNEVVIPDLYINEQVISWIRNHFTSQDLIYLHGIEIPGIPNFSVVSSILHLSDKKVLRRVLPGVYVFPESTLTQEEIIKKHYICDGNVRNGYIRGASFAYNIGLTDTQPNVLYIATNRESQKHGRTIFPLGVQIHVRSPRVTITNENYLVLQMLDILPNLKKYSSYSYETSLNTIAAYINKNQISLPLIDDYLPYYPSWVATQIHEIKERL